MAKSAVYDLYLGKSKRDTLSVLSNLPMNRHDSVAKSWLRELKAEYFLSKIFSAVSV